MAAINQQSINVIYAPSCIGNFCGPSIRHGIHVCTYLGKIREDGDFESSDDINMLPQAAEHVLLILYWVLN